MIPVKGMYSAGNADGTESEEYRESTEQPVSAEYPESMEKPGNAEQPESMEEPVSAEHPESTERAENIRHAKYKWSEKSAEKPESAAGNETTEYMESSEKPEQPPGNGDDPGNTESPWNGESRKRTKRKRESERHMRNKRKAEDTVRKKKLTGSFAAKVAAFFLLVLSTASAVASGLGTIYLVMENYYGNDIIEVFLDECSGALLRDVVQVRDYIAAGELGRARAVCEEKNIDIALLQGDLWQDNGSATDNPILIWTTYKEDYDVSLTADFYLQFPAGSLSGSNVINYHRIHTEKDYVFRAYVNTDFPEKDNYAEIYRECRALYHMRFAILWVLGISIFAGLNSFLFLMCSAGHRNGMEGIQPSVFSSIPLDLYTAFYGITAFFLLLIIGNLFDYTFDSIFDMAVISAAVSAEVLWCTFYLRELTVRMKLGDWWKNSVVYYVLRLLWKIIRLFWRGSCFILKGVPSILGTLICFVGICILEFLIAVLFRVESDALLIWLLEKIVLFPAIVYIAMMCKRLLNGSRALAEGRQEEIVDTSHMFGDFMECGENLNNIGKGISRAVAERMKSEHLKTELITNVSHDIKTPLTSIINYANLIAEETTENEKIREYSEVLVRQSARMKKLLEDLLEASKATTGNLEVNFQPCEVSVILSQAIGEYQQRMEEKQLELIVTQPEQEINILADGRHLWRVFDNLLNNICKYAREDSRVYLNVEAAEEKVSIIFRNMSKYALNITPEELQERFVRGDKSRHMDGNGLGLSIAKSLMDLMNGRMEIVTDGDLFKVILSFEELVE